MLVQSKELAVKPRFPIDVVLECVEQVELSHLVATLGIAHRIQAQKAVLHHENLRVVVVCGDHCDVGTWMRKTLLASHFERVTVRFKQIKGFLSVLNDKEEASLRLGVKEVDNKLSCKHSLYISTLSRTSCTLLFRQCLRKLCLSKCLSTG